MKASKRYGIALAAAALAFALAMPVFAQSGRAGIGFIVGEPTGISGKRFITENTAIDAGAAWSLVKNSNFHIHADYLHHNFSILKREFGITEGELPLYFGIGGRIRFDDDDSRVGVRLVGGVSYIFDNAPLDVFFEIAPIMDLVPKTELDFNAGAGLRFWFE
jgi:hypothetical protein